MTGERKVALVVSKEGPSDADIIELIDAFLKAIRRPPLNDYTSIGTDKRVLEVKSESLDWVDRTFQVSEIVIGCLETQLHARGYDLKLVLDSRRQTFALKPQSCEGNDATPMRRAAGVSTVTPPESGNPCYILRRTVALEGLGAIGTERRKALGTTITLELSPAM